METTKRESSTSADVSGRPSLEELMDSYTVPENEFRLGHPVQILACCWRELLGEFLGTSSVIILNSVSSEDKTINGTTILGVSLCFGLVVATMVYALASISHAHVNPVVTLGVMVMLNVSMCKGIFYIASQILGAIVGSALTKGLLPEQLSTYSDYGATTIATNVTMGNGEQWSLTIAQGFGVEAILTFYLVFTIFATSKMSANDPVSIGKLAPLAIGFNVFVCHIVGVPLTGASLNPARSLGPAIISGVWNHHYIYWTGPVLGSISAAIFYKYLFLAPHSDTPEDTHAHSL